jgi:transcription-repair coupling factor (superfamily II helicase)
MSSLAQEHTSAPSGPRPALARFLSLANRDGALAALTVGAEGSVAVGDAAQGFAIAAVAEHGARRPVVVAVPNGATAERLAHEIAAWIGPSEVALFPAWETLPFERVSPAVETMGHRLELMWRLRRLRDGVSGSGVPSVIVSTVRALLQRLGPHVEDAEPVEVTRGAKVDLDELVAKLVAFGYRREYQVEHRGELAVRGSIVDVFPSTALSPRASTFGVMRSTGSRSSPWRTSVRFPTFKKP